VGGTRRCRRGELGTADGHGLGAVDPGALDRESRAWLATMRPQATRHGVDCFHGGPKNPVMQWIRTAQDAAPYLLAPRSITLVAHTHQPAAFLSGPGRESVALRPQAGRAWTSETRRAS
jgi:hypothetical protein